VLPMCPVRNVTYVSGRSYGPNSPCELGCHRPRKRTIQ
jgi:hypothetical protein